MRYVLLSTPGGHEWEHPIDLIVDTEQNAYFELWAYESNKPTVDALNSLTEPRYKYTWHPWSDYALEVDENAWAEHHGETFEETTARLFNDLPALAGEETKQL